MRDLHWTDKNGPTNTENVIFVGGPGHNLRGVVKDTPPFFDFYKQLWKRSENWKGELEDGFRVDRYMRTGLHVPLCDHETGEVTETRRLYGYLDPACQPKNKPQDFFDGTDTQTD